MRPALTAGDEVLVGKWAARFGTLHPGDIVVVRRDAAPDRVLIKRIIAGPGDRIAFRSGQRQLGGVPAAEPWLSPGYQDLTTVEPLLLGDHDYFVAGDNRWDSRDSRAFGPVERDEIIGRVWLRLWPYGRFGRIAPVPEEPPVPLQVPGRGDKPA